MCECFIGLLRLTDDSELTTVNGLKEHIQDRIKLNEMLEKHGLDSIKHKEYTIEDYVSRRSTNLIKFKYCPMCGKKIEFNKLFTSVH